MLLALTLVLLSVEPEPAAPAPEAAPPAPETHYERRPHSDRTRRELEEVPAAPEPEPSWSPASDSPLLRPRSPWGGLALGLGAGFGAGYYYAGETSRGVAFSLTDALALGGLIGTTLALNQQVIRHDLRTGRSRARDERPFMGSESSLYTASWVLAAVVVGSRVWQALDGYRAAQRTNDWLDDLSIVPLL